MDKKFIERLARRYLEVHHAEGVAAARALAARTVGNDEALQVQVQEEVSRILGVEKK